MTSCAIPINGEKKGAESSRKFTESSKYQGREYTLVQGRKFSLFERGVRGFLGVALAVASLGLLLLFKPVRDLFTQSSKQYWAEKTQVNTASHASNADPNPSARSSGNRIPAQVPAVVSMEIQTDVNRSKEKTPDRPTLLFLGAPANRRLSLNFELSEIEGQQELVPVVVKYTGGKEHSSRCEKYSALEVLYEIARINRDKISWDIPSNRKGGSPFKEILQHPANHLFSEEEFFQFILDTNPKTGKPRVFNLSSPSMIELVDLFNEKNKLNKIFQKCTDEDTLLTHWAVKSLSAALKLLDVKPDAIKELENLRKPILGKWILKGSYDLVKDLACRINENNVSLKHTEDIWIAKVCKDNRSFTKEEFQSLEESIKRKIYFAANALQNKEFVSKLNEFGMKKDPVFYSDLEKFSYNMDFMSVKAQMKKFLVDLKEQELLITEEEFNKRDARNYVKKVDDIGRIQGRDFIEETAKKLGLTHIKVPKKIAVIKNDIESIDLKLGVGFGIKLAERDQLTVYAEKITQRENYLLTLDEAKEFMLLVVETGFFELTGNNFIVAEDGIYFIDTEYTNFEPNYPDWDTIENWCIHSIKKEDEAAFKEAFDAKKAEFKKNSHKLKDREDELDELQQDDPFQVLTNIYRRETYKFPVSEILE